MKHDHQEETDKETRLIISAGLNLTTTIVEIVGGIMSGSLSLISYALHNLSDTTALIISLFASFMSKRKNTEAQTFGGKRAEILAALFNACVLIIVSAVLFKEAYLRLLAPEPINGLLMFAVALVGLVANLYRGYSWCGRYLSVSRVLAGSGLNLFDRPIFSIWRV